MSDPAEFLLAPCFQQVGTQVTGAISHAITEFLEMIATP